MPQDSPGLSSLPTAGVEQANRLLNLTTPLGENRLVPETLAAHEQLSGGACRLEITALSSDARVALTLRCLGGLSTEEIARGFLIPESTAAQRIVRAKRALRENGATFEMPAPNEMAARLASVLQVVYLIFNEGYAAAAGDDWMRPALVAEAIRLGRVLAVVAPDEPEVHGLLA